MARPKEELDLWDKWYEDVLSLYSEGGSDVEVKAMIWQKRKSFSNNLWDRWMEEEPEFWETIKRGRSLSEGWWHRNGRTNLKDKEFNYTGWYMQMKNRFGWTDRVDNTTKDKEVSTTTIINLGEGKK